VGTPHRCNFCALNDLHASRALWDTILLETTHFHVIPTIGPVIEGWVLIVSKQHALSMASLDAELIEELAALRLSVAKTMQKAYGTVAVFEHGPIQPQSEVGCGVDHAHLHVVGTGIDLLKGSLKYISGDWRTQRSASLMLTELRGKSYLYLEQPLGVQHVLVSDQIPSQLFRRVIADHFGRPYNWRENPALDKVQATLDRIAPIFHREVSQVAPL
jgi:ATP adenylyltransferase